MKRIRIAIIIMVILIAGSVGIFFAAKHTSRKNSDKAAEEAQKLVIFDFDENNTTKLTIHNEGGDYEMTYNSTDGWNMVSETDFQVNSNTAVYICTAMSNLTANRIIEDADKSKFGFDDPIKLTLTTTDSEYTLYIGDPTPTNENYYVMKEGSDNIYLIDNATGSVLCATKDSLKSEYIADFNPEDVEHFALWKGSENDDNILFSMNKTEDGTWAMDKPYKDSSVYLSDISAFINNAIRDKIYTFGPEDCPESDYAKYGFDDPQFVFEITGKGKNIKVIFGDYNKEGTEMYGLFPESGQVVTFEKNTVTVLGYDTASMMNKYFSSRKPEELTTVKLTVPDGTAEFGINDAENKYTFNGKEIDIDDEKLNDAYFGLLNSFNDVYFESVDRNAKPEGTPEVTVEYTLSDTENTVVKYEYIPVPGEDSNTYWTLKNGEYTGFIVRKKVIANISETYNAVKDILK